MWCTCLVSVSSVWVWLVIGCSAYICEACLRQASFFNKKHAWCLCPLFGSGLSSGARIVFVKPAFGGSGLSSGARLVLIFVEPAYMQGICVLFLGLAYHRVLSLYL